MDLQKYINIKKEVSVEAYGCELELIEIIEELLNEVQNLTNSDLLCRTIFDLSLRLSEVERKINIPKSTSVSPSYQILPCSEINNENK